MAAPTNFREQAERWHDEAERATLDNVRDRCLRAEAAWIAMADRHERVEAARAEREAPRIQPVAAGG